MWPIAMCRASSASTLRREDIGHMAHRLVAVDLAAVAGGDTGALLAAMLQRVQPEVGEVRRFRMAVDGEDAAFFVELIEHAVISGFADAVLQCACP